MKRIKAAVTVLALVVLMVVPVQAANTGAQARFAPKCWCGGTYKNMGSNGMNCRDCSQPVYTFYHSGFAHSATGYYCLSGHQN